MMTETGPVLPSRAQIYHTANELAALAQRAREFATPGPRADLALALKQLDRAKALLGIEPNQA